jgi:hypothetical protein
VRRRPGSMMTARRLSITSFEERVWPVARGLAWRNRMDATDLNTLFNRISQSSLARQTRGSAERVEFSSTLVYCTIPFFVPRLPMSTLPDADPTPLPIWLNRILLAPFTTAERNSPEHSRHRWGIEASGYTAGQPERPCCRLGLSRRAPVTQDVHRRGFSGEPSWRTVCS